MEAGGHMDLSHPDTSGLVGQGLAWAVYTIAACAAVVCAILLLKYLVVKLSPRTLCDGCNRYYSVKRAACPFCGAAPEREKSSETAESN
ncbi:MAG TPA: hypothetical protein ENN09_03975 [Planctomycetes bacterium]|mgnify:CR=1 FL=1|nr:hypothetical protein [Planctomycetota bacterium]